MLGCEKCVELNSEELKSFLKSDFWFGERAGLEKSCRASLMIHPAKTD